MKTVYFDSTFGHPWVTTLNNLFLMRKESKPFLKHIFQVSEEGEDDDQWIKKLDTGDCIIITGDQGHSKPRLPLVCKEKNITHITLSANVHHSNKFERARAIIALWPHILQTFHASPGSRFQIQQNSAKNGYNLVPKKKEGSKKKKKKTKKRLI